MSPQTPKRDLGTYLAAQRQGKQETGPDGPAGVVHLARPAAAAQPALTPAAPARKPRRRSQAPAASVWDRVEAMHVSARTEPGEWDLHTLRLPAWLDQELAVRVVADRARIGSRTLSKNHYYAAALAAIPHSVNDAVEWGREWQRAHGIGKTLSKGSGTHLPLELIPALDALTDRLTLLKGKVPAWQVHARAVERLLGELNKAGDEEGPAGGDGDVGRPGGSGSPES